MDIQMKTYHLMVGLTVQALLWGCGPAVEGDATDSEAGQTEQALTAYSTLTNAYTGLCLGGDATKPVAQTCQSTWTSQRFQLLNVDNHSGLVRLKHLYSGLCLGDNKTKLEWESCANDGWWSEHWILFTDSTGYKQLMNRYSGLMLGSWPSAPLRREAYDANNWSQKWNIVNH